MGTSSHEDFRLLVALAEELKLPLLQIARDSELKGDVETQYSSEIALKLIDSYVLGIQPHEQSSLKLEPVTLSSVLYDTAEALLPHARQNGFEINVDIGGKFGPVMGDRQLLQHAFTVLGYEFMNSVQEEQKPVITLATHKSKSNVVAGIFTDNPHLTADAFRRAKALVGTARQTLPSTTAANGAGIFIADSLLKNLSSTFKIARHNNQVGLVATLLPSKQLQIV